MHENAYSEWPKSSLLYSSLFPFLFFYCLNTLFHFFPSSSTVTTTTTTTLKQKNGDYKMVKLEGGLARARAAIRKAARTNSTYMSRGPLDRNPYAFLQSYVEMEKRFKIWVYKEGEPPLFHRGSMKEIYSIEGHMIDELESPHNNRFAARHPDEAQVFFLPIGFAEIIHNLYIPHISYDRRPLQNVVEDYVQLLANKYPYWNRSRGADHFFVACHDWGPDASAGNPELFRNFIRVLCNANVSEGFKPERDVSLPEIKVPNNVELGPPNDLNQSENNRSILAFFARGLHGHVREALFHHWKGTGDKDVQAYEYLPKNMDYFELTLLQNGFLHHPFTSVPERTDVTNCEMQKRLRWCRWCLDQRLKQRQKRSLKRI